MLQVLCSAGNQAPGKRHSIGAVLSHPPLLLACCDSGTASALKMDFASAEPVWTKMRSAACRWWLHAAIVAATSASCAAAHQPGAHT